MIVVLNGYPGVGKLTIGREIADLLDGKLLDIHSIYNVAFALTEFKSPEFIATVEKIEAIAHDLIRTLPSGVPVVLTAVLAGSGDWADQEWLRIVRLAELRPPLYVVHVSCSLDENIARIQSQERILKLKPRDPAYAIRNQTDARPLYGMDEANLLELDTTGMPAIDAARVIAGWIEARWSLGRGPT